MFILVEWEHEYLLYYLLCLCMLLILHNFKKRGIQLACALTHISAPFSLLCLANPTNPVSASGSPLTHSSWAHRPTLNTPQQQAAHAEYWQAVGMVVSSDLWGPWEQAVSFHVEPPEPSPAPGREACWHMDGWALTSYYTLTLLLLTSWVTLGQLFLKTSASHVLDWNYNNAPRGLLWA